MTQLPKHIAVIMDGNGRWANQRNLPRIAGHREGAKRVQPIVEYCAKQGIQVLSLFAFSLENWGRPPTEVQFLMKLMLKSLQRDTVSLHENNVRLQIIGERKLLDEGLRRQVEASEQLTQYNTGLTLVIALNYSGRWDIAQAAQQLALQANELDLQNLETIEQVFQEKLAFSQFPEPDLLIRTSGEQRISNFMLWQLAYTEIYFSSAYWPDFTPEMMHDAIHFYQHRQRRFGLIPTQVDEYAEI